MSDAFNTETDPVIIALQANQPQRTGGSPMGQSPAVADLTLAITNPPTQAEVQAVSDKVDELLAALRSGGGLAQ